MKRTIYKLVYKLKDLFIKFLPFLNKKKKEVKTINQLKEDTKQPSSEQIELFESIDAGDLVFCDMPLAKKDLEKIESGHTARPYLIVKKYDDYLLGYSCSSNSLARHATEKQVYILPHSRYNLFKKAEEGSVPTDTNIDLRRTWEIPIKNIRFYMTTLEEIDLQLIERKLNVIGKEKITHFEVKNKAFVGDVYLHNQQLYYVYSENKNDLYCYPLLKVSYNNSSTLVIDGNYYLVNIKEKEHLKLDESFHIYTCKTNEMKMINDAVYKLKEIQVQTKKAQKAANKKKQNEIRSEFEIGNVYRCEDTDRLTVYLYSAGKYKFGVDYELANINTFKLNKVYISKNKEAEFKTEEDLLLDIIDEAIDRNGKLDTYFEEN